MTALVDRHGAPASGKKEPGKVGTKEKSSRMPAVGGPWDRKLRVDAHRLRRMNPESARESFFALHEPSTIHAPSFGWVVVWNCWFLSISICH